MISMHRNSIAAHFFFTRIYATRHTVTCRAGSEFCVAPSRHSPCEEMASDRKQKLAAACLYHMVFSISFAQDIYVPAKNQGSSGNVITLAALLKDARQVSHSVKLSTAAQDTANIHM